MGPQGLWVLCYDLFYSGRQVSVDTIRLHYAVLGATSAALNAIPRRDQIIRSRTTRYLAQRVVVEMGMTTWILSASLSH